MVLNITIMITNKYSDVHHSSYIKPAVLGIGLYNATEGNSCHDVGPPCEPLITSKN